MHLAPELDSRLGQACHSGSHLAPEPLLTLGEACPSGTRLEARPGVSPVLPPHSWASPVTRRIISLLSQSCNSSSRVTLPVSPPGQNKTLLVSSSYMTSRVTLPDVTHCQTALSWSSRLTCLVVSLCQSYHFATRPDNTLLGQSCHFVNRVTPDTGCGLEIESQRRIAFAGLISKSQWRIALAGLNSKSPRRIVLNFLF